MYLRIVFLTLFSLLCASVEAQDISSINKFMKVADGFYTGGQPQIGHLAKLKSDGIKTIINLRYPDEYNAAEEEAEAMKLGLRYYNIPVVYRDPKNEQVDEFLRIADDPGNRPVFIHCTAAIRASTFWMIRRVLRDGWTLEKAEAEAKQTGLVNAPHLEEFARNYINQHKKK